MNTERDKFLILAIDADTFFFCTVDGEKMPDCVMQDSCNEKVSDCMYAFDGGRPSDCKFWVEMEGDGTIDFSTTEGFFKLLEHILDGEYAEEFMGQYGYVSYVAFGEGEIDDMGMSVKMINPDKLADAYYEFLKSRGE